MDFSTISTKWALLEPTAKILILAEPERMPIAQRIRADNAPYVNHIRVMDVGQGDAYAREMSRLTQRDLLIVLLTMDGFMVKGYREVFSPFSKPNGFAGKYIFIRLDIPESSLLTGLDTPLDKVESILEEYRALRAGQRVRVTTDKGTDITTTIGRCDHGVSHHARSMGGMAFLPPSEISEALCPFETNGVIVVDVTVGEIRFGAELIDPLGIVDRDVIITVRNGLVADIAGGDIAMRLKKGLDRLDPGLQTLVELGHGLSDLAPTGIIGVDESMNGTCHFGIGDRNPYHVDVVVSNPRITVLDA